MSQLLQNPLLTIPLGHKTPNVVKTPNSEQQTQNKPLTRKEKAKKRMEEWRKKRDAAKKRRDDAWKKRKEKWKKNREERKSKRNNRAELSDYNEYKIEDEWLFASDHGNDEAHMELLLVSLSAAIVLCVCVIIGCFALALGGFVGYTFKDKADELLS